MCTQETESKMQLDVEDWGRGWLARTQGSQFTAGGCRHTVAKHLTKAWLPQWGRQTTCLSEAASLQETALKTQNGSVCQSFLTLLAKFTERQMTSIKANQCQEGGKNAALMREGLSVSNQLSSWSLWGCPYSQVHNCLSGTRLQGCVW